MTNLTAEFDAQHRREFLREFRAANPHLFGAPATDDASERATAIARLGELTAKFHAERCAPLSSRAASRFRVADPSNEPTLETNL